MQEPVWSSNTVCGHPQVSKSGNTKVERIHGMVHSGTNEVSRSTHKVDSVPTWYAAWSVFSRPLCIPSASGIGVLRFKKAMVTRSGYVRISKRSRQATKQKIATETNNKSIIPRRLERRASGPAIDSLRLLCQGGVLCLVQY